MGFKHVGKKVETSDFRVDKDFYFERAKLSDAETPYSNVMVDTNGKVRYEAIGRRLAILGDNNDAITLAQLTGGIMSITPTGNRTKEMDTTANILGKILTDSGAVTAAASYEQFEFCIINLASSSHYLDITFQASSTTIGSMRIEPATSGLFRIFKTNTSAITVIRVA